MDTDRLKFLADSVRAAQVALTSAAEAQTVAEETLTLATNRREAAGTALREAKESLMNYAAGRESRAPSLPAAPPAYAPPPMAPAMPAPSGPWGKS